MRRPLFLFFALVFAGTVLTGPAFAEVSFFNLDLDKKSSLVFQSRVDAPVFGAYSAGFLADLEKRSLQHLSWFPEQLTYLSRTNEIQIQNRFGVFRSKERFSNLLPLNGFPNFLQGNEIRQGKLGPVATSPDGRWLSYQRETSAALAEIVLLDLTNGKETIIAQQTEYNLRQLPLKWSNDGQYLIYQKSGQLYYLSISQLLNNRTLAENLRLIGPGLISSVQWGPNNQIWYIAGSLVYEILSAELFTRSLYQEFLNIGRIIGRLPQVFAPIFDQFWVSSNGENLLLQKDSSGLFVYPLRTESWGSSGKALELPSLLLPRGTELASVLWSTGGKLTILLRTDSSTNSTSSTASSATRSSWIYRLDTGLSLASNVRFSILDGSDVENLALSPDGSLVALVSSKGIVLNDYDTWKTRATLSHPNPLHVLFIDNSSMLVAGRWYSEQLSFVSAAASATSSTSSATSSSATTSSAGSSLPGLTVSRSFLFFSQFEELGFDSENSLPTGRSQDRILQLASGAWRERTALRNQASASSNTEYRVYLEQLYSGPYANMVMVRRTKELGTFQLFKTPVTNFEPFPALTDADAVNFENFTHGSRQRNRSVALSFDGIDSADGLDRVLRVLKEFGVRATFFLNGEFIRRHPASAKQIAEAGHEVASMFYMHFNLSDPRYRITSEFIKQGLARNEDEYFEATGREMGLLWRTPYGIVNSEIIKASRELNYTLVSKDVDSLDYVIKAPDTVASGLYLGVSAIIQRIIDQKKPGSIISMTLGRPGVDTDPTRVRDDYLFDYLDVLINALVRRGYAIVPVSTLIEQAR